jgi:hypothetical protein
LNRGMPASKHERRFAAVDGARLEPETPGV